MCIYVYEYITVLMFDASKNMSNFNFGTNVIIEMLLTIIKICISKVPGVSFTLEIDCLKIELINIKFLFK